MKFILLLFSFTSLVLLAHGQDSLVQMQKPQFFITGAIGYANKGALGGGSANILFPSQFGIYARAFTNEYKAKQLPDDYKPRSSFFGKALIPQDMTNVYSIGVFKEMTLKKTSYIYKAGFELGPCIIFNKAANFTPSYESGGWLGYASNYNASYTKSNVLGLLLRPKLKMMGVQNYGIELASSVVIKKSSTLYTIELSIVSGKLKGLKKKSSKNKSDHGLQK